MGFFKKLFKGVGNVVKGATKMISLNNLGKVATGNVVGLGAEFVDRAKNGVTSAFSEKYNRNPVEVPSIVTEMASQYVQNGIDNVAQQVNTKITNDTGVKNFVGDANKFFSKLWFQTTWQKHKKTILITLGFSILTPLLILWYKKRGTKSRR